jgi:hypothetical protein
MPKSLLQPTEKALDERLLEILYHVQQLEFHDRHEAMEAIKEAYRSLYTLTPKGEQ